MSKAAARIAEAILMGDFMMVRIAKKRTEPLERYWICRDSTGSGSALAVWELALLRITS
jgi:hypothetical protein